MDTADADRVVTGAVRQFGELFESTPQSERGQILDTMHANLREAGDEGLHSWLIAQFLTTLKRGEHGVLLAFAVVLDAPLVSRTVGA